MIRAYSNKVEYLGMTLFTSDAISKVVGAASKHFELPGESPIVGIKFEGFRISLSLSRVDAEMIFEELLRSSSE